MANIADFKAQLRKGGARSNQFFVTLNLPVFAGGANESRAASFLCNATSLPAVTISDVPLTYRGRPVHFAGEREFAPWTVTIINDGDFKIRSAMEAWSDGIASFDTTNGLVNPRDYQVDLFVTQIDRNGDNLKSYKFYDAYPTEIGQIALAYDNPAIQTFDITFQYNFFVPN